MNVAEILRALADKISAVEQPEPQQAQQAQLQPVQAQHDENPEINTQPMVAPLQQKLELLKKAAGIDSAYDEGEMLQGADHMCAVCGEDPCGCEGDEEDPLNAMKRIAGLPVVVQLSGADNDIEG
jgi:hypothetical protein